jgi:hypothetical protein
MMSIARGVLTASFAVAFVGYYVLVWAIRAERLGPRPSVYEMLSNPFSIRRGHLTERGKPLRTWLLLDFGLLVVLGLGLVFAQSHPQAIP